MRSETLLTPLIIAQKSTYLDWDSQPSLFKHYPDFCYRIPIDSHPALSWIRQVRCITDHRTISGKPYRRLNIPSAGNLHPIEMYIQIRHVEGVLSGIYHVDVVHNELVMIEEIGSDGLEPFVGFENRFNGFLVFFSLVPFRSSWKYGLRAWRYLYLDLGHQIAGLKAVCHHFGMELTKLSQCNADGLNEAMGFGSDEFIGSVYGIGTLTNRTTFPLRQSLMRVLPCDYTYQNHILMNAIQKELPYSELNAAIGHKWNPDINVTRRSAREFYCSPLTDEQLKIIVDVKPIGKLEIVHLVMKAHSMHCGMYCNGRIDNSRRIDVPEIVHLLLEQRFIANASVVSLIFAENFDAHAHVEAGMIGQELYMAAESFGAGCSGIGAFYDEEASHWNNKPLLYAVAIGSKV